MDRRRVRFAREPIGHAHRVEPVGRFDLDHLGAEIGEQTSADGTASTVERSRTRMPASGNVRGTRRLRSLRAFG